MAGPSIQAQRERIEAILATVPGLTTVLTPDEIDCPLSDDMLPAALVWDGPGVRSRTNTEKKLTTRTFYIGVLVAKPCSNSAADQRAALDAAEAFLEVIPDFFATYACRLELNKQPLAGVWQTAPMTDESAEWRMWGENSEDYSAFTLGLPVTTHR